MDIVKGALAAGLILGVLDGLWLGVIAKDWIFQQLGEVEKGGLAALCQPHVDSRGHAVQPAPCA